MKDKIYTQVGAAMPAEHRQNCQLQIRCHRGFKDMAKRKAAAAGLCMSEFVKRLVVGA